MLVSNRLNWRDFWQLFPHITDSRGRRKRRVFAYRFLEPDTHATLWRVDSRTSPGEGYTIAWDADQMHWQCECFAAYGYMHCWHVEYIQRASTVWKHLRDRGHTKRTSLGRVPESLKGIP